MWYDSWTELWRTVAVGTVAYLALIAVLRASGKRTLAKLNAFDLVVTVALGSTLSTILLDPGVSWAEGATALALLVALQYLVAWTSVRISAVKSTVTSRPTLVLRDGRPLHEAMKRQRLTESELMQALRATGAGDPAEVAAVVLESDGTLSVIGRDRLGSGAALPRAPED